MWEKFGGKPLEEKGTEEEEIERAKELAIQPSGSPSKVLFVGLGSMGKPMALAIQKAGIPVVGVDISLPAMDAFVAAGGKAATDLRVEAEGADVLVLMPNTAIQAEAILFGGPEAPGISTVLPANATIILSSTVAPSSAVRIQLLLDAVNKGLSLVDAPVSGGPSRAATGDLAIMASGPEAALGKVCTVLQAMSLAAGKTSNLHFVPGGLGSGSSVKLVNNLLAGVHLCAAAEAMAFARKKNMDLNTVFDVVSNGAAYSYMLVDRVPRMLKHNPPVHSALDTFVKDLGLVLSEARRLNTPLFLGAAAHQMLVQASASGLGKEDDSAIVRLWEKTGVDVRLD